jgi:hypothetical protein
MPEVASCSRSIQAVPYVPSNGRKSVRLTPQQIDHHGLDVFGGKRLEPAHEFL